jgi:hypothetical protein
VLTGIGMRLRHATPLSSAAPVLWDHAEELDRGFAMFFAELRNETDAQRRTLGLE